MKPRDKSIVFEQFDQAVLLEEIALPKTYYVQRSTKREFPLPTTFACGVCDAVWQVATEPDYSYGAAKEVLVEAISLGDASEYTYLQQQHACPKCGEEFIRYEDVTINHHVRLLKVTAFNVVGKNKIKILGKFVSVFIGRGKKQKNGRFGAPRKIIRFINRSITIHLNTGEVWDYRNRTAYGISQRCISNAEGCHSMFGYDDETVRLLWGVADRIAAYHKARTGYDVENYKTKIVSEIVARYDIYGDLVPPFSFCNTISRTVYEDKEHELNPYDSIFRVARGPYINAALWSQLANYLPIIKHTHSYIGAKITKAISTLSPDVERIILDNLNLKKWERRFVAEEYIHVIGLKIFKGLFTSVDLLKQLIKMVNLSQVGGDRRMVKSIVAFIRALIELKGEKGAIHTISTHPSLLWDSARMWGDFQLAISAGTWPNKLDLTGNMKDIHDRLSRDYKKMGAPDLPFDDREYLTDSTVGDIRFEVAKRTHDLIEHGATMDICVGSYWRAMMERHCTIVFGYEDSKPVICIELDGENKCVQAKLAWNVPVGQDANYWSLTHQWLDENKIEWRSCWDMQTYFLQTQLLPEDMPY